MNKYNKYKQLYLEKNKKTLILFKANWCRYCIEFLNTWNDLKKEIKNINFITYDSEKDMRLFEKYNIQSFPTIILKNDKRLIKFDGIRNKKNLIHFLKNN